MSARGKVGTALKIIVINVAVLAVLLGSMEVAARLAYPEFKGHIHSATRTLGINNYRAIFKGFTIRVPYPGYEPALDKPLFVVLGYSVSFGYGMAYEDIYWVRLSRLAETMGASGLEFLALDGYGNSMADSARALESLTRNNDTNARFVLYQFNFNDLLTYSRADLLISGREQDFFPALRAWRVDYLNRSVFLRVGQHYAGVLTRRRTGSCDERGLDALAAYTLAYGSRSYREEAETSWRAFEDRLGEAKRTADMIGAQFLVFVSPLVFDIDREGRHPYSNGERLDFSCATIDPRSRLNQIAKKLEIRVIDPLPYLRQHYERRLEENNFTPFFFTADENHFTPIAAGYIAEYLAAAIFGAAADTPANASRMR